jgi:hypothetical protein
MTRHPIAWYQESLVAGKTVKASYNLASGKVYRGTAKRIFSAQDDHGEQWFVSIEGPGGEIAAFPIEEVDAEVAT